MSCFQVFEVHDGYMYPEDGVGLGIDIDEKLAEKYPCTRTKSSNGLRLVFLMEVLRDHRKIHENFSCESR